MNAVNVPVTSIESSCLFGDSTTQKSDGSFDLLLQEAQKKLKGGLIPWSQFEALFQLTPLNFDLNFDISELNSQLSDHRPSDQPSTSFSSGSQSASKPLTQNSPGETSPIYLETDLKVIKEVLQNYIPLPYLGTVPSLMGGDFQSSSISRANLQAVIDEILTQADFFKSSGKTQLSLTLAEKDLGEILISLINKQGSLTIQINANQETKKILDDNLRELEAAFRAAHLAVTQIKIVEVKKDEYHS